MKAISIVAPSGTKIATGTKALEVRRWTPELYPNEDLLIVENSRFLRKQGDEDSDGRAVAVVRVAAVRPFVPDDIEAAAANSFEEGWLAWELTDVRQIECSVPVLAARGIYDLPFDVDKG